MEVEGRGRRSRRDSHSRRSRSRRSSRSPSAVGFHKASSLASSRHLQLVQYSQKNPGRLAQRLLTKMSLLTSRGGEADVDQSGAPRPAATAYLLSLMMPQYPSMGVRNLRELKTCAMILD